MSTAVFASKRAVVGGVDTVRTVSAVGALTAPAGTTSCNCPPSAVLESREPDSMSAAAEQGTVAHALAEWKLRRALNDAPTFKPESGWIDTEMEDLTDSAPSSSSNNFFLRHLNLNRIRPINNNNVQRVMMRRPIQVKHIRMIMKRVFDVRIVILGS